MRTGLGLGGALRLVQMVSGGYLGEAASYLALNTALTALAAELDEPATPLIDHQHRRRVLETWSIDETTRW